MNESPRLAMTYSDAWNTSFLSVSVGPRRTEGWSEATILLVILNEGDILGLSQHSSIQVVLTFASQHPWSSIKNAKRLCRRLTINYNMTYRKTTPTIETDTQKVEFLFAEVQRQASQITSTQQTIQAQDRIIHENARGITVLCSYKDEHLFTYRASYLKL